MPAIGDQLRSPCEFGLFEASSGGELPLGFCRKILALPSCIGQRVLVGDVDDGMIISSLDAANRTIGTTPVGALEKRPPLRPVIKTDTPGRLAKTSEPAYNISGIMPG